MRNFFYQIGATITNKPWSKPIYEKIVRFLNDEEVKSILDKYDAYLHGGILWDSLTWDLDIMLKYDWDQSTDWNLIEAEFNKLNDLALNKHRILLDVTMTNDLYEFPTKQYLLNLNKDKPFENWVVPRVKDEIKIRLGYFKKIDGDEIIEHTEIYPRQKLTDGYLYKVYLTGVDHKLKIANKILSMPGEQLPLLHLHIKDFLAMSKEEFIRTRNGLIETF